MLRKRPRNFKSFIKGGAELFHKGERTAEIYYISVYFTSLSKTSDSLINNGVKNTGADVWFLRALIDQRLYIALCKYAAA